MHLLKVHHVWEKVILEDAKTVFCVRVALPSQRNLLCYFFLFALVSRKLGDQVNTENLIVSLVLAQLQIQQYALGTLF